MNINFIREQFPALSSVNGNDAPIFMDNPGGTQMPQSVIDAMVDCLVRSNANLGGPFATSKRADSVAHEAHLAMADFVNANTPREIVIGQNMTTLTLHISRSIGRMFSTGDEIILTRMEHDANVSPWVLIARDHGLKVKYLPFDRNTYEFDLEELDRLLNPRTRLVAFNHASNMTGTINDVKAVVERAHGVGALVYVDSVQFAPHGVIDVQDLGCDFLVCSPYKFFGPHMGVLWGRESVLMELEPYKLRAAAESLPDRFETGTLSHEGMAGITATVDYFATIGRDQADEIYRSRYSHFCGRRLNLCSALDYLTDYEIPLTKILIEGLDALPGVKIHGITNPNAMSRRVPTVSFTAEGHHPKAISEALAKRGIQVWDGHNYAVEPTNHLGLLEGGGVVRIGLAHYNTMEEVNTTVAAVTDHLAAS